MMANLKYQQEGNRDLRLDLLRGFCLFSMSMTHGGLGSYWKYVTGGGIFLVNAAEGFFFISGMTLGIISVGRPLRIAVERLLKRTWVVYLCTLVLSFGFATLLITTDIQLWEDGTAGIHSIHDTINLMVEILTMRINIHGSDVLIAYVIYMGITPLVLWALDKKYTVHVILSVIAIYVLSQLSPEITELPFASFRHWATNAPVYFSGLLLGYYRENIAKFWKSWKFSLVVDGLVCVIGLFLLYQYATKFSLFPMLGEQLLDSGTRYYEMPFLNLCVVFIYIRMFWLLTTYLWRLVNFFVGWLLIPLGQASLFVYMVHLFLIPIIWNYPKVFENKGMIIATFYNAALIGAIFILVKIRGWVVSDLAKESKPIGFLVQHSLIILVVIFLISLFLTIPRQYIDVGGIGAENGVYQNACEELYKSEEKNTISENVKFSGRLL